MNFEGSSKNRDRAVVRAWEGLLKICAKESRKSPSCGEFVAGVKSARQAMIRIVELGDSVHQERLSKGLGAVQTEEVFRKAIEAELDMIEQKPRIQGPFSELETLHCTIAFSFWTI